MKRTMVWMLLMRGIDSHSAMASARCDAWKNVSGSARSSSSVRVARGFGRAADSRERGDLDELMPSKATQRIYKANTESV